MVSRSLLTIGILFKITTAFYSTSTSAGASPSPPTITVTQTVTVHSQTLTVYSQTLTISTCPGTWSNLYLYTERKTDHLYLNVCSDNLYVQHPSTPLELRLAIHLYIKMIFFFFTRIDSKGVRLRRPPVSIFLFSWGGDPLFWASISVVKLVTSDSINTN